MKSKSDLNYKLNLQKMTELEYKEKLKEAELKFLNDKRILHIEYATSQRKFMVGDIIKNDCVIIKVLGFGISASDGMPIPIYKGISLRKDLVPKKNGDIEFIYGNNDVELVTIPT